MSQVIIGSRELFWQDVVHVARDGWTLSLDEDAWLRVRRARAAVLDLANSGRPYYGINTGLGALCDVVLEAGALQRLSRHTLMSHACGVGPLLAAEQVRAIICAAVINYSHGCSGVSEAVVHALLQLLEHDVLPEVPTEGSVGYLTHMAHIGLTLIGEGQVHYHGERMPASQALSAIGLKPVVLGPKDGLCLVNGTPAMTGLACLALDNTHVLADWADVVAAMSFEALGGQLDALDDEVAIRKRQPGVRISASQVRHMLAGSARLDACQGWHLQDALSVRAIPQVHGACRDQWQHAAAQVNGELASATDNPLVIERDGVFRIVSQANPHGESVAMACDLLAIAVCEWSSISERRSYRLVTPQANRLPPFLTRDSGVKSGMMIAQYSAASLVADNKRLAAPAVVDNFLTSGLQEDHLSLGECAVLKLGKAVDNAFHVLAIEYLLAAQAFDLIEERPFGQGTAHAWQWLRQHIGFYEEDHPLSDDIAGACLLMRHQDSRRVLLSWLVTQGEQTEWGADAL